MKDANSNSAESSSEVVDTTATTESLTIKEKAGEAAEKWLARNRSLVLRQTPVWAQSLAAILIGLGGLAVAGGIFFRIDEVVTVTGQLKSIGGTVEVMTPAGGRVAEIHYEDGELVKKGQLLLRFDTRQAASEKDILHNQIDYEIKQLKTQLKTLDSQKNTLGSRKTVLNKRLSTKKTMLAQMQSLVEQGGFQKLQFLEQQDQAFELEKQITDLDEQLNRILLETERLNLESKKSVDRMRGEIKKAELQLQYQNVLSPITGIVFDPKANVEGVIASGQPILSIVPQKGLYAEVFVPNKDIGYIKLNQEAKVRVDAFPFSRYGDIQGKVAQISADALPPNQNQPFYSFPVKLNLQSSTLNTRGVKIPLKPGMSITTNLKLRDKRVISLISDIFVDQTDSIRSLRQQ